MLYQTVNEQDFIRAFDEVGRYDSFSVQARKVLFEWYDDLSAGTSPGIELDPIGICCDWGEYTLDEIVREFGYMVDREHDWDDEDWEAAILEELRDNGVLLEVDHIAADTTYLFAE